jgi:hypothetical protein
VPLKRRRAVYAACALAALAVPGPARAASSGVHIDPSSPPGKEYAIPLQTARGQGDGPAPATAPAPQPAAPAPRTAARSTSPTATPPPPPAPTDPRPTTEDGLFGAGISRTDPRSQPPTRARNRTAPPPPAAPQTLIPAADRRPVVGGGPVLLFWVAAALALLVPGLAVGLGVRRWRRA